MKHLKRLIALLLALTLGLSAAAALAAQERTWDEDGLNAYLNELAEESKDEWQKAIYRAGVENLTEENGQLTFFLRNFSPDVKNLPKQKDDPEGWLEGFFANVASYRMEATLTIEDGVPTKKSENKLKSDVRSAAAKAKAAFGQQAVKNALLDLLFPEPYKDQTAFKQGTLSDGFKRWWSLKGMEEGKEQVWAALMYAQASRQLNLNKGPHALQVSVRFTEPEALLSQAGKAALDEVSRIAKANTMEGEELMAAFTKALGDSAAKMRRGEKEKKVFTVDIDYLFVSETDNEYQGFLNTYTYHDAFDRLEVAVRTLPDYPAQDYPKNGRLSGSTSGTKIIVKAPKDEAARYIQLRSSEDDSLLVSFFIRPGGSATVRARQGDAYMLIAAGATWYGEEGIFGPDSSYSMTDAFEVLSSRYYHTITLEPVEDGNMKMWSVDPDRFRQP